MAVRPHTRWRTSGVYSGRSAVRCKTMGQRRWVLLTSSRMKALERVLALTRVGTSSAPQQQVSGRAPTNGPSTEFEDDGYANESIDPIEEPMRASSAGRSRYNKANRQARLNHWSSIHEKLTKAMLCNNIRSAPTNITTTVCQRCTCRTTSQVWLFDLQGSHNDIPKQPNLALICFRCYERDCRLP